MSEYANSHRCICCDWSPTDDRSIFNPSIAEYGSNRLEIDEVTGNMWCRYCMAASDKMQPKDTLEYTVHDTIRDYLGEGSYRKRPIFYD